MIELVRDSNISMTLKINKNDIPYLLNYLDKLNKNDMLNILFKGEKMKLEIIIDEFSNELIIKNKKIKIFMDNEELEYFIKKLNGVTEGYDFFPSELCERKVKNKYVSIYCIII